MHKQVHPRRAAIHTRSLGESLADAIAEGMGSWKFIIIQSAIVLVWIGANLWLLSRPFDSYPFILLNLLFSTQAAYAAPVIMMSQNRQSAKDRVRDDVEAHEVDSLVTLLQQNTTLTEQVAQLTREVHSAISGQPLVKWPAMPTLPDGHYLIGPNDGYASASGMAVLAVPPINEPPINEPPIETMTGRPRDPRTGRFQPLKRGA